MGGYERQALERLQREKPNLTDKLNGILGAFYRLDRERDRVGQMASPQHIKRAAIFEYIELSGSHGYEPDMFRDIIFSVDEEHLKLFYERQKRAANG